MPIIAHKNLLFGDSAVDTVLAAPVTLTAVNRYRNLTIDAGVIVQSATTRYGPLDIICSGKLTIAGTLHANEKGERLANDVGTWWSSPNGEGAAFAVNTHESAVPGRTFNVPGGGSGSTVSYVWSPTEKAYYGCYSASEVAAGADGDSIITTPIADFIDMYRGGWFVGGCGGSGGEQGGMPLPGGRGAGMIRIFARSVEIVAGGEIQANGGDGADGDSHSSGGGGGGGILIVAEDYSKDGTVECLGGTGGGTGSGGTAAGDGADGIVQIVRP